MCMTIYLGVRINSNVFERIPVHSINSDLKVEELKNLASRETNVPSENLELVFCGNALENNSTLESCGIRPSVTIHVLRKKIKDLPKPVNTVNEADISYLMTAFKNAMKNPNYRSALQRLSRPEVLENIIAATPGLAEDPIALSIIQDPELLIQLSGASTVKKVVETHPSLAEAASCIVAFVHEEATSAMAANPGTSSGYSYSLDALSDDEEFDSSQSSDSQPRHGGGENIFSSPITTAQLAAALAAATGSNNSGNEASSGSVITTEMFNQAMQQAFGGVTGPSVPDSDPSRSSSNMPNLGDLEATSRQLARQLQQMHEIGLRDDAVNLQALQATDWNVQEAINLVFSGAIGDTDLEDD